MVKRKVYTAEFKREAVLLSIESDLTVNRIAKDLGISAQNLYKWRTKYFEQGQIAFPGKGNKALTREEKEIAELKKAVRLLEQERDILKKTIGYLAEERL